MPPSTAMFLFFSRRLIYGFWRNAHDQYTNPLARPLQIALQVVRTSFEFHLRECMGSSFPPTHPIWIKYLYSQLRNHGIHQGQVITTEDFFRGRVKKYSFFWGGALICMKFSRGTPIFPFYSGVYSGLLIFRAVTDPRSSGISAKSCEIPPKTRNTAKSARNISQYMSAKHI